MAEQGYFVTEQEYLELQAYKQRQGEVQLLGAMQAFVLTCSSQNSAVRRAAKMVKRLWEQQHGTLAPAPQQTALPARTGMISHRRARGLAPGSAARTRPDMQPTPAHLDNKTHDTRKS